MGLDDIKKRAKDLLAELTEPRPDRHDRATHGSVEDPAVRTDQLDRSAERPVADRRAEPEAQHRVPVTAPTGADELPADPERMVTRERADSYSARWHEVKGEFVDAPRQAVAKADALVGELLEEMAELFAQQRRRIEQDLDRDEVSTEDLRVGLRRYRSFFDRLLSV